MTVSSPLLSPNCCTDGCSWAQMGHGPFFIGCSIPRSPTHLVCRERHLCTNLFVTIYWRDDLSSCHALVAAWCLKNMASQKFQAARPLGTHKHTSQLTLAEERREFESVQGVCKFISKQLLDPQDLKEDEKIIHFHVYVLLQLTRAWRRIDECLKELD